MSTIRGVDVSNHQWPVDMRAVKAAGVDFVVIKGTEGVGFDDPRMAAHRANAHAAGLVVLLYHFARAGNVAAEADFFLRGIGALQHGEIPVLDWEVPAPDPVGWCHGWLDRVHAATAATPLLYMNRSTLAGHAWAPVAASYPLWLAAYDGSPAAVGCGAWPALAMKQYSDKGTVPGIAGPVDLDVFYGTTNQLTAYGPQGAAMPLTAADISLLLNTPAYDGGPTISAVLKDVELRTAPQPQMTPGGPAVPAKLVGLPDLLAWFDNNITTIRAELDLLRQQVVGSPGMTCQGNPRAVLSALGQAASTAASA